MKAFMEGALSGLLLGVLVLLAATPAFASPKVERLLESLIVVETLVSSNVLGGYQADGEASGIVVSKKGYILTAGHVARHSSVINCIFRSGHEYKAKLVKKNLILDTAVFKLVGPHEPLRSVRLSRKAVATGDQVLILSNPYPHRWLTTSGIVSSATPYGMVLDATASTGSSGGAVFNRRGRLIGMVITIRLVGFSYLLAGAVTAEVIEDALAGLNL